MIFETFLFTNTFIRYHCEEKQTTFFLRRKSFYDKPESDHFNFFCWIINNCIGAKQERKEGEPAMDTIL